jgi:DNA-binding NarL/FixJ family response regulator
MKAQMYDKRPENQVVKTGAKAGASSRPPVKNISHYYSAMDTLHLGRYGDPMSDAVTIHAANRAQHVLSQETIHIAIADHHETVRYGLSALLRAKRGIEIVGEANSPKALWSVLAHSRVDVIIFDLCDDDQERLALVQELRRTYPTVGILSFTTDAYPYQIDQLLHAGVGGFVLKRASTDQILAAIRAVHQGQLVLPNKLAPQSPHSPDALSLQLPVPNESLTQREIDVLQHIVDGATNKEIASLLCIAPKTVEGRIAQICAKLGARSRTDAAVRAVYLGLVKPRSLSESGDEPYF